MNCKSFIKPAVLLAAAVFCTATAVADVTINVKATTAPYLYVWDTNDSHPNGAFPGTQLTETKVHNGVTYWTKTFTGYNELNAIFSTGSSSAQSGDYTGLTGEVYFEYDGSRLAWGVMPNGVIYDSSNDFIYYVDIFGWEHVHAYAYNGNSTIGDDWPGQQMTCVGQDEAGYSVYRATWSGTPSNVIITKDGEGEGHENRREVAYSRGAYLAHLKDGANNTYSTVTLKTIGSDRLAITASNFSDTNFRSALGEALGITLDSNNENSSRAFTATEIEVLDVTDKGITSLSGISHFTNLRELYAGENSIGAIDFTGNYTLEVLDIHGNTGINGFATSARNERIYLPTNSNGSTLRYLDMSNCGITYMAGLSSTGHTLITTLKLNDNPGLGWTGAVGNQTQLKYLDAHNSGLDNTSTNKPQFTAANTVSIEYMDLSDNSITDLSSLSGGLTSLKTFKVSGNTGLKYVAALQGASNLEHLEYANIGLTRLTDDISASCCPKLRYLDISNNKGTETTFNVNAFTALDTLKVTGCTKITELNITNNPRLLPTALEISGNTALTTLNLSGNTLITEVPALPSNNITTLTMSGSNLTSIANADATHFPKLTTLDVSNNALSGAIAYTNASVTSLDISENPGIISLTLTGMKFNSDALNVGNNTGMTSLSVTGTGASGELQYIKTLSSCTSLTSLTIDDIDFYPGTQNVEAPLSALTNLQTLNLRNDRLSSPTLTGLSVSTLDVSGNSTMKTLTANGNANLTNVNLTDCPKLTRVVLDNTAMATLPVLPTTNTSGSTLGLVMRSCAFPSTTKLSFNRDYNVKLDLSENTQIVNLDLSDNPYLRVLMLKNLTALKTLNLANDTNLRQVGNNYADYTTTGNNWEADGNGVLYFKESTALEELNAANCYWLAEGLALKTNYPSLRKIDASNNSRITSVYNLNYAPALEELDLHDSPALVLATQLSTLTPTNNPLLATLDISNCDLSSSPVVTGFASLATVNVSDNPKFTTANFSGNALTSIDISGCTKLATLNLSDNNFGNIDFLNVDNCAVTDLDISRNNISSLTGISNASLVTLRINGSHLTSLDGLNNFSSLKKLYAESNDFSGALQLRNSSLDGIDLNENTGITTLDLSRDNATLGVASASRTAGLKTVLLHGCTGLTKLDVSGNRLVRTSIGYGETNMSDNDGDLYIADLSSLEELNISDNLFEKIGHSTSASYAVTNTTYGTLAGLTGLKKLVANYNRFPAFQNGVTINGQTGYTYYDSTTGNNKTITTSGHAAQPTANNISALTALEYLELTHNQVIMDSVSLTNNKALTHLDLSYNGYGTKARETRDKSTTDIDNPQLIYSQGLYHLDLNQQTNLVYLDISETAIHETAIDEISVTTAYADGGGYVWIKNCPALETFKTNGNGMNSLGLKENPNLKHVEARQMNGISKVMSGDINFYANSAGETNSIEYFDVSDSYFNGVGVAPDCIQSAIKTLILDGNPLAGYVAKVTAEGTETYNAPGINLRNGDVLTDCRTPDLETLSAVGCTNLTEVNVNFCRNLTTCLLTGNENIKTLKMMNCIGLTEVPTLDKPEILETLMCGYNTNLSNLDVSDYVALQTLNCQNNNINTLDLNANSALARLYASNNCIEELTIPGENIMDVVVDHNGMFSLDLGTAPYLTNLDFSNNHICAIDLSGAGNMLTPSTVFAENNSRTLRASLVQFVQTPGAEPVNLYYFQMDDETTASEYNATSILMLNCVESSSHYMNNDGFELGKASNWTGATAIAGTRQNGSGAPRRVASTADIGLAAGKPGSIYGNILALEDESTPLTYDYATGNSAVPTVNLGMQWTSEGAITTAVNDLSADKLTVTGGEGCIRVVTPTAMQIAVYDVSGRLTTVADLDVGENIIDAVPAGLYIAAGNKIVVR
mgnify:CR=1 FL=1